MRLGLSMATALGTVYILEEPVNCSHSSVVMAPAPMLTTPILLAEVVNALPVSSAYKR